MKSARNSGFHLLVAVAILGVCGVSDASYVPLPSNMADLTAAGAYTTVGNYTYNFLSYSSSSTDLGEAILAGSVGVSAVSIPNPGFELTGAIAAPAPSDNDITFTYLMSTSGPPITAISLNANGATNGGTASITEDVYTDQTKTDFLGQITVTSGTQTLQFAGSYLSLYITEDIIFNTYTSNQLATFSLIDQTFAIPEPSSLAMIGLGLAGVGIYGRRRGRKIVAG